jgi:hypothetical protein
MAAPVYNIFELDAAYIQIAAVRPPITNTGSGEQNQNDMYTPTEKSPWWLAKAIYLRYGAHVL